MTLRRSRAALVAASILSLPLAVSMLATPAAAQWTVFDPSNYVQNVLQAARTLQQVNQQITSLQNEATMLVNQARNLASLPYSSLQQLKQNVRRTQALLQQAQNIAFDVRSIDQAFQRQYGSASMSATDRQLVTDARSRWQNTVGGLQDAMRVQAGVVGNIDSNRAEMANLVTRSQGAIGALQATQAGNQLLALQAQQLADLTAMIAHGIVRMERSGRKLAPTCVDLRADGFGRVPAIDEDRAPGAPCGEQGDTGGDHGDGFGGHGRDLTPAAEAANERLLDARAVT